MFLLGGELDDQRLEDTTLNGKYLNQQASLNAAQLRRLKDERIGAGRFALGVLNPNDLTDGSLKLAQQDANELGYMFKKEYENAKFVKDLNKLVNALQLQVAQQPPDQLQLLLTKIMDDMKLELDEEMQVKAITRMGHETARSLQSDIATRAEQKRYATELEKARARMIFL